MKKAFTLAEIMIVLSVIAVLTAILLPSARNVMPNEKVMKFKKAHGVLYSAIRELVTSDKYYLNGDLGTKIDGTLLHEWNTKPETQEYFCQTFADVLSAKTVNCARSTPGLYLSINGLYEWLDLYNSNGMEITNEMVQNIKNDFDRACKIYFLSSANNADKLVTSDGVWYANLGAAALFGAVVNGASLGFTGADASKYFRIFSSPSEKPTFYDSNGMDIMYKIFCIDIDGVPESATADDCVNECPFGYGIRADGKILNGLRADEWFNKSI